MEDFEIKVGDLVKLRDDLIDRKEYGDFYFCNDIKFEGFKRIIGIFGSGFCLQDNQNYVYTKEMIAEAKRPIKYKTIYKRKEPILDDKEREYLANVIKPFRDKVKCIVKYKNYYNRSEYIAISLKNDTPIHLPYFNEDTMYKNMELNTEYILKELGL